VVRRLVCVITAVFLAATGSWAAPADTFTVTILHTNDLHAQVEPLTARGLTLGGYARQATLIKRFRERDPNPVLLSAGDTFQGTLYFNVYEGLADLAFMNLVAYQAMAVGNHEFDRGPAVLARFASLATFPLLAANLDVSREPLLAPLLRPWTILEVGGERLGVIGALPEDLATISNPGPTVKAGEARPAIQAAIDALAAAGVHKVILLSHLGYEKDLQLAPQLRGVDVIVGGHSHTLLGKVAGLPQPRGEYPTVARDAAGNTVLIVHAWDRGRVLGRIQVTFDRDGRVQSWAEAAPVPVDATVPEDPLVRSLVAALERPLAQVRDQVVGQSLEAIPTTRITPLHAESPMGNLIADATLEATAKAGSVAAFINAGGVRAGLEPGSITYGHALAVQPFSNTLVQVELTGAHLKAALEQPLGHFPAEADGLLHPSRGTSYRVDPSRPPGERVLDLRVAGSPVDPQATYRITVPSFIAGGGNGHTVIANAAGYRYDTGIVDVEALVAFIAAHSPVVGRLEGRVTVVPPPQVSPPRP